MTHIEWRTYEAGHCMHPQCGTRRGGMWKMARFPALAFLLRHPAHGAMLFDTGYSRHFFDATRHLPERLYRTVTPPRLDETESLRDQLARDGIDVRHLATVMLSHLHGDHIGGLHDFPHSTILCSREAWNDLQARGRLGALRRGLLPALLPTDFPQRVRWIEELPRIALAGSFAAFGTGYDLWSDGSVLAIPLPGHAAGHYGLLFHTPDDGQVFLIADAAWSSRALLDGVPPPSVVTSWLGDTPAYLATLARLQKLRQSEPDLRIVPSHCEEHSPR
ncbi:MBL fold metallo-hydrolase [Rhodanobacter sp. DHB23]|uniref:MBL fold metallo-hydrolase n=1 Tax=Rhodanobacter sp. DHB23 TaxID=2775923 RepID=UPI00177E1EEF|nr:MBL fold metallo-hydrolase [Rhodanobacter sp. DHB23]MBD8871311.1 MBL fold metallo-hydrolase [Rhodanobacter sp. DHB23]